MPVKKENENKSPNEKFVGHRKRIRERFLKAGLSGMQEYEIVELILSYSIPRRDVKQDARELLQHFGSLEKLLDAEIPELLEVSGIGLNSIALIKLIPQICSNYLEQKAKGVNLLDSTSKAADFMRMKIGGNKKETLIVLLLNSQQHLLAWKLFNGTVDRTTVYVREVAELCLKCGATGVIVGHNHPSGICEPSIEDIAMTQKLKHGLSSLSIQLHDHIIVTPFNFKSLRSAGKL